MTPGTKSGNKTGTKSASAPVLLIEDEPAVMALVRAVLEGHGYAVVPTESGADALRLLEGGDFHGVISDMRTPGGVDGAQVYAWIATRQKNNTEATVRVVNKMLQDRWTKVIADARKETPSPAAVQLAGGTVGLDPKSRCTGKLP